MPSWLKMFAHRPRLLFAAAAAIVLYVALPDAWPRTSRVLTAWNAGTLLYLVLAWIMMARSDIAVMRERADEEDEGAIVILALTVLAAVASLAAIAVELQQYRQAGASWPGLRLALSGGAILSSWCFVHTMFALHYAHDYYGDGRERPPLAFPDEGREPDYWDFAYFAFTMGAASQTSDVTVVDHNMRRLVLAHTILSFLFNTIVLALAINVGAGLLGGA